MIVQLDGADLFVGIIGIPNTPPPRGYRYVEVPDSWIADLYAPGVHRITNGKIVSDPPITPPPTAPAPNIKGLVKALAASPSIDQTTKDSLVTALEGS